MSVFFFRLLFFSKIVDHLRKCATILGRERLCFDFNREKSRKCFLFDKITGKYSVVFAYFSSSFFIIIIFFLSVCFQTGEKKLLLKVHTSILSLSSLKFSSVFFSSFFSYFFAGILYWTKGTSTSCPFSSSQQISKTKLRTWLGIFFFETVSTTWDMVIFILSSRRAAGMKNE